MSKELVANIKKQTEVMFVNAGIMLKTCNLDFVLCDMPVWKHVYHMLHSCEQWFISPLEYEKEPDIPSEKALSRGLLSDYLETVRTKIICYLETMTDEKLYEIPKGCASNRLGLILSQYRHFYAHLGNINATTIMETNEWPRVVGTSGKSGKSTEGLFE